MKKRMKQTVGTILDLKALLAIVLLLVVMPFLSASFYSIRNISQMLLQVSYLLIIAIGVTFVMVCGCVDLSVGGIMCMSGIFACMLQQRLPLGVVLLIVLVVGALLGSVSGILIAKFQINSFITTLGLGLVYKGINLVVTDTSTIQGSNPLFKVIGTSRLFGVLPVQFLIAVGVVIAAHLVLTRTEFGRNCYAIGGELSVAAYSGINVVRQQVMAFVISGVMAALGGFLVSARMNSGNATFGELTPLLVNCGIVVGGVKLSGGVGGALNALIGIFFFAILENAMNILGIDVYIQQAGEGLIIVLLLGFVCLMNKRAAEDV